MCDDVARAGPYITPASCSGFTYGEPGLTHYFSTYMLQGGLSCQRKLSEEKVEAFKDGVGKNMGGSVGILGGLGRM